MKSAATKEGNFIIIFMASAVSPPPQSRETFFLALKTVEFYN